MVNSAVVGNYKFFFKQHETFYLGDFSDFSILNSLRISGIHVIVCRNVTKALMKIISRIKAGSNFKLN